jgi:transposase-like protein
LIQVVQEAFINGVSTRKVERLQKALGIEGMSASQVSEITRGLDEQVEAFRSRTLETEYPVLWVDGPVPEDSGGRSSGELRGDGRHWHYSRRNA